MTIRRRGILERGARRKIRCGILESVLVYKEGRIRVLPKEECGYAYKQSVFYEG